MLYDEIQSVFQICSYLLTYPDKSFQDSLTDLEVEINELSAGKIKLELEQFIAAAKKLSIDEFIHTYVYTFDFGKKTNLYVTYMTSGEQRERGVDLLYLKNYYKLHGFEATDLELPDYLPLMLEFAGQVDGETLNPVFERYYENVIEIRDRLTEQNNLYRHVLEAVIGAVNEAGIKETKRRGDEVCSINFFG
ncbi:nitrate reductase molybdenum cofactor assembly chaperone [Bacillota bacterium Lsc_1132]